MSEKVENPQAFPVAGCEGLNGPEFGMSLRDYFAAVALTGLLANGAPLRCQDVYELAALAAFKHADAMLLARSKS